MKEFMKQFLGLCFLSLMAALLWAAAVAFEPAEAGTKATGFYQRETISGLYKICYYNVLGNEVAVTFKAVQLCPLSMEFEL